MKILQRNVIYLSKELSKINLNQEKFYPFINSPLIHSSAFNQFVITGIHAMCDLNNIKSHIPHRQEVQEFVFFGRSNVGKSSLINSLIHNNFVETSKKPGKTKQLAFLKLKSPLPTLLVDAPGYGYASDASKQQIKEWGRLIQFYLKHTPKNDNQIILLLIDILHGFKQTDGMLIKMLQQMKKSFMIVYTKCDRAKEQQIMDGIEVAKQVQAKVNEMNSYVHFTSSRQNLGINQLRSHLLYKMVARQLQSLPNQQPK